VVAEVDGVVGNIRAHAWQAVAGPAISTTVVLREPDQFKFDFIIAQ
jgi:hypothetical protein